MKKFILWTIAPMLLPPALLRHRGPYIPDDQLRKEIKTVGPNFEIDMANYGETVIVDMPYIKFEVDSVNLPPKIWEPFLFTFMYYTCITGGYNGIDYYMRVLPLKEEYIDGPTPENSPESTWEIDALFTKDPHFVFHGLKVGDKIPRNRMHDFESHGTYDLRRIVLKSDTSWAIQMSAYVPDVIHKRNTIVAFWRTDISSSLVDSIMKSQYWSEEMEKKPDSLFLRLAKYKIEMFR